MTYKDLLSVEERTFYDEAISGKTSIFKRPKREAEVWLKKFFLNEEHSEILKMAICSITFRFSPSGNWGYRNITEPSLYLLSQVLCLTPRRIKAASENVNFSEKTIRHMIFTNSGNSELARDEFIRTASPEVMTLSVLGRLLETVEQNLEQNVTSVPFWCFSEAVLRERVKAECEAKRLEVDGLGMPDAWVMKMFGSEPEVSHPPVALPLLPLDRSTRV